MKKSLMLLSIAFAMLLASFSIGCGSEGASPSPTITVSPTAVVTATPQATAKATSSPAPAATATSVPTPAPTPTPAAKPITLKVSCAYPETNPRGPQLKKFKELVEKYTNGRVTVDLYLGAVLFPASAEWEAVTTGAVDISFTPPFFASIPIPQNTLWYNTAIFDSHEHGWAVVNDPKLNGIFEDLALAKGVKQLGIVPGAGIMGSLVSKSKELKDFLDIKGLKIGISGVPSPLYTDYAGGVMVTMNDTEAFIALSQGIIDGENMPVTTVVSTKLYEVAKYGFIFPSGYFPTMLWMNKARWDSLPQDVRDIMANKVVPELKDYARQQSFDAEQSAINTLKANMKAVYVATPEQMTAAWEFLKNNASFKKNYVEKVGPEILSLVEQDRPSKSTKT